MAETDYFLKIDGIEGESTDDKHKSELDIQSWSYGASQSGGMSYGGGGGEGKVSVNDFHFTKSIDKSSPKLFLCCCGGDHIKTVELTCRKAGKDQQEYLKIKLTDVLVSSFSQGGSGGSLVPTDQFSLNFAKIEIQYSTQTSTGALAAPTKAAWDVKANKKP